MLPTGPSSERKQFDDGRDNGDAAILRRCGFEPDPVIEAYKRDVDRSLIRQNLMRTPDERWELITEALRLQDEMRRAGARARGN